MIVGQLPALLGFSTDGDGLVEEAGDLVAGIADGQVQPAAASIGIAALTVILVLRRAAPLVPGFARRRRGSHSRGVGPRPCGCAGRGTPAQWSPVPGAGHPRIGRCRVSSGQHSVSRWSPSPTPVCCRGRSRQGNTDVDPGRAMAALGLANVACGATSGFPVSASSSRTPSPRRPGPGRSSPASWAAKRRRSGGGGPGVHQLPALVGVGGGGNRRGLVGRGRAGNRATAEDEPGRVALSLIAFGGVAALGVLRGITVAVALSPAGVRGQGVAAPRDWSGSSGERATTTGADTPKVGRCWPRHRAVRRPLLRQCRAVRRLRAARPSTPSNPGPLGGDRRGADHGHRHRRLPTPSYGSTTSSRPGASGWSSPN